MRGKNFRRSRNGRLCHVDVGSGEATVSHSRRSETHDPLKPITAAARWASPTPASAKNSEARSAAARPSAIPRPSIARTSLCHGKKRRALRIVGKSIAHDANTDSRLISAATRLRSETLMHLHPIECVCLRESEPHTPAWAVATSTREEAHEHEHVAAPLRMPTGRCSVTAVYDLQRSPERARRGCPGIA